MKLSILIIALWFFASCSSKHKNEIISIESDIETEAVPSPDDAADDPAIWLHPDNVEKSTIIGTNKEEGIIVYNLMGQKIHYYPVGRVNNIDLRYDFPLNGEKVDILAGSNRSNNNINIFKINKTDGSLTDIAAQEIITEIEEVYGFCLYKNKKENMFYACVVGKDGHFEQYFLEPTDTNTIKATKVRDLNLGQQAEGMVADDEMGYLYIAEEEKGIWKFFADPGNDYRKLVADTSNKHLVTDLEGITIYYGPENKGYLILSCQGNNTFAIFERENKNKYLGSFSLTANSNVDGVEETDGIDVLNMPLGNKFPNGLFVCQDGINMDQTDTMNQNFKLVDWEKIAHHQDLKLQIYKDYNIRN